MRANRPTLQEEPGPGDECFNGGGSRRVRRRGGYGGPFRSGVEGVSKLSEDRSQGGRAGRLDCCASYFGVRTGERQTGKEGLGWGGGDGLWCSRCPAGVSRTGPCSGTYSLGSGVPSGRRHRTTDMQADTGEWMGQAEETPEIKAWSWDGGTMQHAKGQWMRGEGGALREEQCAGVLLPELRGTEQLSKGAGRS